MQLMREAFTKAEMKCENMKNDIFRGKTIKKLRNP